MPLERKPNAEPIPGYRLISTLGSGGFGEVWKCEAPGGLFKAIKFVFGNLNALDTEGIRAEQEFHALQRVKAIRHPFILSIERVEIIEGELVIVMELADSSLHERLLECQQAGQPGIPREELFEYLRDAAEALDWMNEQHDLQHLDIKPRNLFLVSRHVKIADFGLVKDLEGRTGGSSSGLLGGVTPLYAPPETFRGIISRNSDQYSLAVVYQELLTGVRPFNGKTPRQLAMQHTGEEPDLRSLPAADRQAVAKALCKNPHQRFANCMEFVKALFSGKMPPVSVSVNGGGKGSVAWRPWSPSEVEIFLAGEDTPPGESDSPSRSGAPEEGNHLTMTVAQPLSGSLRPTLVVGVGAFGRQAIEALRCRFIDRFGNLRKLPLVRFLYLDSNPQAIQSAQQGPAEQALSASEVYHLPLQAVGHYRRNRQALQQITDWLPLEKLYALPRSLETGGSRALGRLAFADNYMRLATRLKRELEMITRPEVIDQAVSQTGLAMRSAAPQVMVLASANGGTGGGMLVDLAYTVRRALQDLGHDHPEVQAFLMCGAPSDPAMPREEQANLYATLTEINHFSDPAVAFATQYGHNGPVLHDAGAPYQSVYLIRMGHRSPDGVRRAAARIASYVFHDLTTPLGGRLSQSRQAQEAAADTPFRSFGTHAIWFPRGLMLRVAARSACQRLLQSWLKPSPDPAWSESVAGACAQLFDDPAWQTNILQQKIEQAAAVSAEGTMPGQALTAFLSTIEEQADLAVARDDPPGWCQQAIERVREWVGSGISVIEETSEWKKSRLHRIFASAVQKIVDEYEKLLSRPAAQLIDQPGFRLAAADVGYDQLIRLCQARIDEQQAAVQAQVRQTEKCWEAVDQAIDACLRPGSFSLFGGSRLRRLLHAFVDRLSTYARQRLAEESLRSVQFFFSTLIGRLKDLKRDLVICQQRLRHLEDNVMSGSTPGEEALLNHMVPLASSQVSGSHLLRDAAVVLASRIVLPDGAEDLEAASSRFLDQVTGDQWFQLDRFLQDQVLTPMGGLNYVCTNKSDLRNFLGTPLLDATAEFLGRQLPVTDVCEAELSSAKVLNVDLAEQTRTYFQLAAPAIASTQEGGEELYLLVPNTEPGRQLGELAREALPQLNVVRGANHTDVLLCREQAGVRLGDLHNLLDSCKAAYAQSMTSPLTTPHARCDITDWVPLDP